MSFLIYKIQVQEEFVNVEVNVQEDSPLSGRSGGRAPPPPPLTLRPSLSTALPPPPYQSPSVSSTASPTPLDHSAPLPHSASTASPTPPSMPPASAPPPSSSFSTQDELYSQAKATEKGNELSLREPELPQKVIEVCHFLSLFF